MPDSVSAKQADITEREFFNYSFPEKKTLSNSNWTVSLWPAGYNLFDDGSERVHTQPETDSEHGATDERTIDLNSRERKNRAPTRAKVLPSITWTVDTYLLTTEAHIGTCVEVVFELCRYSTNQEASDLRVIHAADVINHRTLVFARAGNRGWKCSDKSSKWWVDLDILYDHCFLQSTFCGVISHSFVSFFFF